MNYVESMDELAKQDITVVVDFQTKKFCLKQQIGRSFIFLPLIDADGNEFTYMYFKSKEDFEDKIIEQAACLQKENLDFTWAGMDEEEEDYKERYGDFNSRMGVEL